MKIFSPTKTVLIYPNFTEGETFETEVVFWQNLRIITQGRRTDGHSEEFYAATGTKLEALFLTFTIDILYNQLRSAQAPVFFKVILFPVIFLNWISTRFKSVVLICTKQIFGSIAIKQSTPMFLKRLLSFVSW